MTCDGGVRHEAPLPPAVAPLTLRRELARKALHLTSVVVPLAYAAGLVTRRPLAALVLLLFGVALAVELGRARSERVRARFARATGALLRAHEHHRWAGATWLLGAFALSLLLFPRAVAVAAMWAVSVGDASAAVVGRTLGRHRLLAGSTKTLEGSVACAVATFVGASLVARLGPGASVVAALAAAAAEAPSRPLDDNVRVALAVGGGILLWRMAFS